ncbi:MAG: A24 family peptidase [Polyangiaceae bacterium]|nr:A24 family peptidase [Polyangiaceae bacterium]
MILNYIHLALPLALTATAAVIDARSGKIPNWLTLPGLLAGLVFFVVTQGTQGLMLSALGALVCFLVPGILYFGSKGRAIGGGDLKLFAALGVWFGPSSGLEVQLASYVLVVVLAMLQLTWHGGLWRVLKNACALAVNPFRSAKNRRTLEPELLTELRMGPCICLASLGFVFQELHSTGLV